jgi:hypothetical protein
MDDEWTIDDEAADAALEWNAADDELEWAPYAEE